MLLKYQYYMARVTVRRESHILCNQWVTRIGAFLTGWKTVS